MLFGFKTCIFLLILLKILISNQYFINDCIELCRNSYLNALIACCE